MPDGAHVKFLPKTVEFAVIGENTYYVTQNMDIDLLSFWLILHYVFLYFLEFSCMKNDKHFRH